MQAAQASTIFSLFFANLFPFVDVLDGDPGTSTQAVSNWIQKRNIYVLKDI
jgi:hypothetical protein